MLTLVHAPNSRSSTFIWLLEELGEPYDIRKVDIRRGDGSGAFDSNNPHPHGKVPVIIHDGAIVFEQIAIITYLTEAFPKARLAPLAGDPKRGEFLTLMAYYAGVMEPAFTAKFMNVVPPRGTAGFPPAEEALAYITSRLEKSLYIIGDTFTAADILYGAMFALFLGSPMLPETPLLRAYADRCTARPAYARASPKGV
ncbi:MAG: glutathione S-transferase family protein [Caulobacterales bacterium]